MYIRLNSSEINGGANIKFGNNYLPPRVRITNGFVTTKSKIIFKICVA